MLLLYNIGIKLYFLIVYLAAPFNKKAKRWIDGRTDCSFIRFNESIWFHFASLGEFEQGRPVLQELRNLYPQNKFVITFFSPSGYGVRKNTPLADAVYYLPLDTKSNALKFINTINPKIAVFTKYEYWYHFFNELHQKQIPLYIISSIFRPDQVFFKWYGSLHRKMLTFVERFFVQDSKSIELLNNIGITNVTQSGDTRFDRVWENAAHPKQIPLVEQLKKDSKVFIAGSTWPQDEKLIADLITQYRDWKFIIAPHEIKEDKIAELIASLPNGTAIRFSKAQLLNGQNKPLTYQTLIIDNIGMLSSLYQYGDIAYIGGGFGAGIHNTLEAAAFGVPVIFGPKYSKFKEAQDLVALKAGFSIGNSGELVEITKKLVNDVAFCHEAGQIARRFVQEHTGATQTIVEYINVKFQNKTKEVT